MSKKSFFAVDRRAQELETIAAVLSMERRDELAELLTDSDVETLRHLVNQGNTVPCASAERQKPAVSKFSNTSRDTGQ